MEFRGMERQMHVFYLKAWFLGVVLEDGGTFQRKVIRSLRACSRRGLWEPVSSLSLNLPGSQDEKLPMLCISSIKRLGE